MNIMSTDELETLWRGKLDYYQLLSASLVEGDDTWMTPSDRRERRDFAHRRRRELLDLHDKLSGT
jgi:hypothetical protein